MSDQQRAERIDDEELRVVARSFWNCTCDKCMAAAANVVRALDAYRAKRLARPEPQAATGQVTGEMRMVPVEPTQDMLNASLGHNPHSLSGEMFESRRDLRPVIWKAMLAAAPSRAPAQAPAVPEELRKRARDADTLAREMDPGHYFRVFQRACERWVRTLLADAAKNREGGQHG